MPLLECALLGRHLCLKYVANGLDYLMHTRDIGRERPKALPVGKRERLVAESNFCHNTYINTCVCVCVWGGGAIYVHHIYVFIVICCLSFWMFILCTKGLLSKFLLE